jgi:tetratricopeptide (TPR) repeat protein
VEYPTPSTVALNEELRAYGMAVLTTLRDLVKMNPLQSEAIKMLNIAGSNMLDAGVRAQIDGIDIVMGNQGNFYVLFADGTIAEYDSSGNVLFFFGAQDTSTQRMGVFRQASSIAVSRDGNLYVADADTGLITYLMPTEFTQQVHRGLAYFEDGLYIQSEGYWRDVLRSNSSFGLAHKAIGQAQFKLQQHEEAAARFRLANDRSGYSDAFWEIRHQWLQEHTGTLIMGIAAVAILTKLVALTDKKTAVFNDFKKAKTKLKSRTFMKELGMAKKVLRHPLDTFYEVRRENKGSVLTASLLYLAFYLVMIFALQAPGFIFSNTLLADLGILLVSGLFVGLLALFIVINFLVSTINDGEGSLKKVYIATAYALAPFTLFGIPLTLASQVLTLNEAFFYHFGLQIIVAWCLLLIFLMVKEVHDFEFGDTVKNLLLTLFAAMITVLVIFVFYILLNQVYQFIYAVIREVLIRV